MRYFDKAFFKFLLGFIVLILCGLFFLSRVEAGLININTAGSEELQTLVGIGPVIAGRIIDYRTQNRSFATINDIKNVTGIGDVTFGNIKDFITVGEQNNQALENSPPPSPPAIINYSPGSSGTVNLKEDKKGYKISAGEDKVAAPGQPLQFKAEHNVEVSSMAIIWTFGDGSVGYGREINHTYEYPGEYVVVVTADSPVGKIVSRLSVKIVPDTLSVTYAGPDRVEVTNSGKVEINLTGRELVWNGQIFIFPESTIIKAGQKISFPGSVTGLSPTSNNEVMLALVAVPKPMPVLGVANVIDKDKTQKIVDEIISLQRKIMTIRSQEEPAITQTAALILSTNKNATTSATTTPSKKSNTWATLKHFFGFK